MPLSKRKKIARDLREQSNEKNHNKAENIMDVNSNAVKKSMHQHKVDTLIHGHTHRPKIHQLEENKTRFVLGDWDALIWWIETTKNGFELMSKPISIELEK